MKPRNGWDALHLLRDPAKWARATASHRQRARALLDEVAALTLFPSTTTMWRGHSSIDYRLTPSLLRNRVDIPTRVTELVEDVKQASHLWVEGVLFRQLNEIEWLALLQHMGTPTPLLDVTSDPLIALYFALRDSNKDGLLIAWNARHWLDLTGNTDSFQQITAEVARKQTIGWLVPPVMAHRIAVQRSRLLLAAPQEKGTKSWSTAISDVVLPPLPPNWNRDQLDLLFADRRAGRRAMPPVVGFRIPRDIKHYLGGVLASSYGISRHSLFPEPSGFGPSVQP